jgi:SAM-dependent methyltransferase
MLNCPICEFTSSYIFTSKNNREIFSCQNILCGHFFTPALDCSQGICSRPEDIEKDSNESLTLFNERNSRLIRLFSTYFAKAKRPVKLLDFGAGNAHLSRTAKNILKDDAIIYCLEPNPACEKLYEKYGLIQIENIKEVTEKIDLIYMVEVIEHLENPILALAELKMHLKPSGKIFISTPLGALNESLTNAYDTPSHLHFFTERSLNLALDKAGYIQAQFKYYPQMYPLPKLNAIRRLIKIASDYIKPLMKNYKIKHLVLVTSIKK